MSTYIHINAIYYSHRGVDSMIIMQTNNTLARRLSKITFFRLFIHLISHEIFPTNGHNKILYAFLFYYTSTS